MEDWNQPGKCLRKAREAAGMSVADVVHRIKFPRNVVEALEADDYTSFSSPTYAKSYLSQYAEFLHIDPTPWLDFFEPAAFTGSADFGNLIESPEAPEPRPTRQSVPSSSSFLPTLSLMLLTGGLIYLAIKGYTYFESRFSEPGNAVTTGSQPTSPNPSSTSTTGSGLPIKPAASSGASPATAPQTNPAPEPTPPPRAIIIEE